MNTFFDKMYISRFNLKNDIENKKSYCLVKRSLYFHLRIFFVLIFKMPLGIKNPIFSLQIASSSSFISIVNIEREARLS